jgi:polysaccharide biosynthesis protein PslH
MWNQSEGLRSLGHQVEILALNTNKQHTPPSSIPATVANAYRYALIDANIRYRPVAALRHLWSFTPYHVQRFDVPGMRVAIEQRTSADRYDLVILESLYATPYLDIFERRNIPVVLRCHNAEFDIWQKLRRSAKGPLRRWYFGHLARTLARYELSVLERVDACACISLDDITAFRAYGSDAKLYHVPFGMDLEMMAPPAEAPDAGPDLYHLGSMDWIPHQEAIRWFVENVWPLVAAKQVGINCHLGSRTMPSWLEQTALPGLHIHSGSIDANAFMRDKGILIAPSFSGSGVMVKIVEAMARGKAIITTTNGARGLAVTNGRDLVISNSPEEWAQHIIRLSTNPKQRKALQVNALAFVHKEHDRNRAAQLFLDGWR